MDTGGVGRADAGVAGTYGRIRDGGWIGGVTKAEGVPDFMQGDLVQGR